jgi:putative copper export protein
MASWIRDGALDDCLATDPKSEKKSYQIPRACLCAGTEAERESTVAEMVHRFSTLALFGAALLGVTGVTTAWIHLKHLKALWTTPYGYALDAKLVVVAIVALLGAWNWRRVGPALGNDGCAKIIRRTASVELMFTVGVLLL